ncbi:Kinesin-like protein KIN-14I [Camellia lanceoleosa]|nr:Kinesin-like protein KIN-14I [Camellia lanceoleosa]
MSFSWRFQDDGSDSSPTFSPKRRKLSYTTVDKNEKFIEVVDCEDKEEDDWLPPPPKVSTDTLKLGDDSTIKDLSGGFSDTQPLIQSVLDGYNVCTFANGQTGLRKTYTMKNSHVPYSDNKLTQLFQDLLGGQAKILMFVHISPQLNAVREIISTLKFAERVATIELGATRVNKGSVDVKELKEQIASLKVALARKEGQVEPM